MRIARIFVTRNLRKIDLSLYLSRYILIILNKDNINRPDIGI